jgi:nucleoside-diphosphate-sugar epimerase
MKLLVTGGSGFVGGHLVDRLLSEGHEVTLLVRSAPRVPRDVRTICFLGDVARLIDNLKTLDLSGTVHLASCFLPSHRPEDVTSLVESNVLLGAAVLEACASAGIPWFINTGTFWQHYEDEPYSPVNLYAATKQAFEDIAAYYVQTTAIHFMTLQLSDTFGPGDTRPKLFNLWQKAARTGEPLAMSPGEQVLDMNYIEDVIDAYMALIGLLSTNNAGTLRGKTFAVSSGERITLRALASVFEKVTGAKLNIEWGGRPYRVREVMAPWSKGEPVPGWEPKVGLEEGIRRTFQAG